MKALGHAHQPSQAQTDNLGRPFTRWQLGLINLCRVMIAWSLLEFGGALMTLLITWAPVLDITQFFTRHSQQILSMSALLGALFNLIVGWLGVRAAYRPHRMAVFFWITLSDAVLTSWALASSISQGSLELTSLVSSSFIIVLAVYAWQTRATTGYFDHHPYPEDEDQKS